MFDTAMLSPKEWQAWDHIRHSLATGSGVRRNPRRLVDMDGTATRTRAGRNPLDADVADFEDDGVLHGASVYRWTTLGRVIISVPDMPAQLYEIAAADYRRLQTLRLELEAAACRRYVPGWIEPAGSPFGGPDRFRKFDPRPAFDGIGSSGLITYIAR